MKEEDFKKLQIGDIVKGQFSGEIFVVTGNYGSHITAVKSVDMTHPQDWELIRKAEGGNSTNVINIT